MAEVAHPGDRVFVAFLINTGFFWGKELNIVQILNTSNDVN